MDSSVAVAAGVVAMVVFAMSTLPMLGKAVRSKDLSSYSRGNLVLSNIGNLVYSVYVFNLPPGPIWLLHADYLVSFRADALLEHQVCRSRAGRGCEPREWATSSHRSPGDELTDRADRWLTALGRAWIRLPAPMEHLAAPAVTGLLEPGHPASASESARGLGDHRGRRRPHLGGGARPWAWEC